MMQQGDEIMETDGLHIAREDAVVVARLDFPPANTMDTDNLQAIERRLAAIEADQDVCALVLTGTGKAFSAGLNLKDVPSYDRTARHALADALNRLFLRVFDFRVPVVGAINGHAIAGGMVLALCCDWRVGPEGDFLFGLAEMRVGVPFPVGAMTPVRAQLPAQTARRLVLSGRNISSKEAFAMGVFDEMAPPEATLGRGLEKARELATSPLDTYRTIRRQLHGDLLTNMRDTIENGSDPVLEGDWFSSEIETASQRVLSGG